MSSSRVLLLPPNGPPHQLRADKQPRLYAGSLGNHVFFLSLSKK